MDSSILLVLNLNKKIEQMKAIQIQQLTIDELRSIIVDVIKCEVVPIISQSHHATSEYISRKITAELLNVSLVTLNEWSKKGWVISYKIGTRVLYKRDEVEASITKVESLKYRRRTE